MIGPTVGAVGVCGWLITTFADGAEVQRLAFVTVNVYVPGSIPETTALVRLPGITTFPGERVRVHVPEEGSPVNVTLPVG